ncbi:MAG: hypothetical protein C0425_09680, partial [Chlorobiaceae bacterium]|nr:hypothetical protein [Chlorobiaceae bacterium]
MLKKEKNIFEILMISSFIFYSLLLVIFSKDGLPNNLWTQSIFPFLADKPLSEDGFYMLTVAKNIASGNGIVYNFNIPTSGIQPLMTFVYAGIFWITNLFSSSEYFVLRIVLLFSAFLQIIFYFLLKKTLNLFNISSDSRTLVLCSIVLFNFGLFNTFLNGLETSLYLVMIVIFINSLVSVIDKKMSNVYLGIVIGLTVLARVDFILIISAFMLVLLFLKKINLRSLIKVGSIAFIISLPWFIYIYQITDSIIPSSGTAQSSVPQSLSSVIYRINVMFFSILDHSVPWIFASNILLSNLATLVVAIFSTIYIIKKRIYEVLKFDKNEILFYYLFSIIPAIIVYVIFFHSTYFYYRYTVPVVPVFLITVTLIISIII